MAPEFSADSRKGIAEGGGGFLIPRRQRHRQGACPDEACGKERHKREQTQEHGRRPRDGAIRPLALRLEPQVTPGFFERDLDLPALDESTVGCAAGRERDLCR